MLRRMLSVTLGLLLSASLSWAGSTAVTGELVYPSQNDLYGSGVGGSAGDGKKLLEKQWRKIAIPLAGSNNYVLSGGTLPASDPDLIMPVAAGSAVIDGHYVEWPATNITLPASSTSHLFGKLVYGGGLVTGFEIEDNTSDSPPASSTKLGTATTSGSAVTSTTDARILGPHFQVSLTSGTSYTVPAGIYWILVRLYGSSGGGGGGGEGGDAGGPSDGANGGSGGNGGSSTFGSMTAAGGQGGSGGQGGRGAGSAGISGQTGVNGTASGGTYNRTGGGQYGGRGGAGGAPNGAAGYGAAGALGGSGGYCEAWLPVTPGSTITYSVGAAGTAGTAGTGGAGTDGTAGTVGLAGYVALGF